MLQIKPTIASQHSLCPYCSAVLKPIDSVWAAMHVLIKFECASCQAEIIEDLKISHALLHDRNKIDLENERIFGMGLGDPPLIEYFKQPRQLQHEITKEIFQECRQAIVINCIDYLYGHCLLKLLNVSKHLEDNPECGVIAIVPPFLRWMVPAGVAEIWTVDIPLKYGRCYYPEFDEFVRQEFTRFDRVFVSEAYSHPSRFDISDYTKVAKHDFDRQDYRISFIWREDRPWCSNLLMKILRKTNLTILAALLQNWKVQRLFAKLHQQFPAAKLTVVGLGCQTNFPDWIEDCRVEKFDAETERQACQIYADSRVIFGVHGSNMLLPSAHAGMTIDLMSIDRLANIAQDVLYQEPSPRLASFRYRYLPIATKPTQLFELAVSMLLYHQEIFALLSDPPICQDNDSK
jgi:hypothetical protein